MVSWTVSGTIATAALVLGVGVHSSAADESEEPRKEITVDLGDGVTMKMVLLPAGEFMMGSHESAEAVANDFGADAKYLKSFEAEHPQHRVKITKPFYLGVSEVTQQQYAKVMGDKPWSGNGYMREGPEYPATYVSWNDAQEFCRRLSSKEARTYRLPTEAQWEYACRAGTKTRYCYGDDGSELGSHAWYYENAWIINERYGHQVGSKRANAWGLVDMHGNAWEWCQDWYDGDYYENSPTDDPTGPTSGSYRVLRGGSWGSSAGFCRSALRFRYTPGYRPYGLGFRVALVSAE